MIIHKQCLRTAFPLIVTGTVPHRIYVPPIILRLRMHNRVTIHLARRSLQHLCIQSHRQSQHIDSPHHRRLGRLYRVMLIMKWGRGTSQVVYFIHLCRIWVSDIMPHYFKMVIAHQMSDVVFRPRKKIIQAYHFVTVVY